MPDCSKGWSLSYLESSEVDDTVNVRVHLEDFHESGFIGDIDLMEFGSLST